MHVQSLPAPRNEPDIEEIDSDIKKNNVPDTTVVVNVSYDVHQYKKEVDSIIELIIGDNVTTNLKIDTLKSDEPLFVELNNTPISDLANKGVVTKYDFLLEGKHRGLRHYLFEINFEDNVIADSVFSVIQEIALENSGVPGLTYTSDFVLKLSNRIYWLNSNCAYSYSNHLKFVNAFKLIGKLHSVNAIYCECGKVKCEI